MFTSEKADLQKDKIIGKKVYENIHFSNGTRLYKSNCLKKRFACSLQNE